MTDNITSATTTSLFFIKNLEKYRHEKPYFINVPPSALPEGCETSNIVNNKQEGINITDIKSIPHSSFTLDKNGFTVVKHRFKTADDEITHETFVKEIYAPEVAQWLRSYTGSEQAIVLSSAIRRRDRTFPELTWGSSGAQQPIPGVHIGK